MDKIKKNVFFISSIILVVVFVTYAFYFHRFYEDVILYGEFETSIVIKLLLITKYRGVELSIYLMIYFCSITLYLINYILYYMKIKIENKNKNQEKAISAVQLIIFISFVSYISASVVGLIFIPLTILSLTIIYVSYLIAKQTIGKRIILNEEVLGIHGPFTDESELNDYIDSFEKTNDTKEVKKRIYTEGNHYFLEYFLKKEFK